MQYPAELLSSFGEERENYFVGREPRVALALREQPWANFLYAFSVFEFALIRAIRVKATLRLCVFALKRILSGESPDAAGETPAPPLQIRLSIQ